MGTSTNQRSPSSDPSWRIFQKTLGSNVIPVERQTTELWRAAIADKGGQFIKDLSSEVIAQAVTLASHEKNPTSAAKEFDNALVERQDCGLAFDLAKRALLRSINNQAGASGFAQELFAEVANYYASRDIPSFVAAKGRIATTSDSLNLKDQIRDLTRQTVAPIAGAVAREIQQEGGLSAKTWNHFVSATLIELKKRGA